MEEPDDPAPDSVGVYDYSVLGRMGHPRVLMTESDFDELRRNVRPRGTLLRSLHDLSISLADSLVRKPDEIGYVLDESGKRLLTQSRRALTTLVSCSYAYKVTGRKKYLRHVESVLRTVCAFPDWHPSHYLDVGEMALGVAIAYDWLYRDLSYDLRVTARKALSDFVLRTAPDQGFYSSEGNWNQVCNAGVMAAAIAVYEKDRSAASWAIEDGVRSNRRILPKIYGEDGNYSEGYDYWGYGTMFQTVIMQLLQTAFGSFDALEAPRGLFRSSEFMLFMAGTVGTAFSYADGGVSSERPNLPMWWFAAQAGDSSLLSNEVRLLDSGQYGLNVNTRLIPLIPCMIMNAGLTRPSAVSDRPEIWYGRGKAPVVMVHTGWHFDAGDCYLGIKGGMARSGHGHMDAGSFVFESQGVRWSEDYKRPNYATMENALRAAGGNFWSMSQSSRRWDIVKMNNLGHSTISCLAVDGSVKGKVHPTDHIVSGYASLVEVYESPDRLGGCLDMTPVLKDGVAAARRTICLENRTDLVVVDEITAKPDMDAIIAWRMNTQAEVSCGDTGLTLVRDGKSMCLTVSSPVSVEYHVWAYERPAEWTPALWDTSMHGCVAGYCVTIPAGTSVRLVTRLQPR